MVPAAIFLLHFPLCRRLFLRNSFSYSTRQCHSRRIRKVLIANRGEIALRVMRTAKKMDIETVAIFSDADEHSLHATLADSSFRVGAASPLQSYLRNDKIIEVAKSAQVDAIHPGYGFLSESADFAELCASNGIIFIGPPPSAIRDMGMKNKAKRIMIEAGVPVIHGYNGQDQDAQNLLDEAKKLGFPIMVKAVCGGGGKGMRIVWAEEQFLELLESARSEAQKAFGNTDMILEKFVQRPRHIEVQIFGDMHGQYVYLWERDCSIQRRHQKIIEEAPAPGLTEDVRHWLGRTAVDAAAAVNYVGAGTVEFIFDTATEQFYFMEMNTRLQVEHPVTEAITCLDLVEWQFRVASGEPLPLQQKYIPLNGHAIEARIYAEDSLAGFMPTAGTLEHLKFPKGVRIETGVRQGDDVSVHYDPMIAKIIAEAPTREQAIWRLDDALKQTHVGGVCSNVEFVRRCLGHQKFVREDVYTDFIAEHLEELLRPKISADEQLRVLVESAIGFVLLDTPFPSKSGTSSASNPFLTLPYFRLNHYAKRSIKLDANQPPLIVHILGNDRFRVEGQQLDGSKFSEEFLAIVVEEEEGKKEAADVVHFFIEFLSGGGGRRWECKAVRLQKQVAIFGAGHSVWNTQTDDFTSSDLEELGGGALGDENTRSPMPGIVEKLFVEVGDEVEKGQALVAVNAMKMEHLIRAPFNSLVDSINCSIGQSVPKDFCLVVLKRGMEEKKKIF